MTTTRK